MANVLFDLNAPQIVLHTSEDFFIYLIDEIFLFCYIVNTNKQYQKDTS